MTETTQPAVLTAEQPPTETPAAPVQTIDISGAIADTTMKEGLPVGAPVSATAAPIVSAAPAVSVSSSEAKPRPTTQAEVSEPPVTRMAPTSILAIDIGGTKVKFLATGHTEPRKAPSGKDFTPSKLVETVREMAKDWEYEAISIGYPGLVGLQGPRSEPGNLGAGWVGFDFAAAFGKPVKMMNDAAMQALGSYEGGRMLFLGLGTGLGSALITGHVIVPLELGRLLYDGEKKLGEVLGRAGLNKIGKGAWREAVNKTVSSLMGAFVADYVVIGGGNSKYVKDLPAGARRGNNLTAFRGGFRVWSVEDVWVLAPSGDEAPPPNVQEGVRVL